MVKRTCHSSHRTRLEIHGAEEEPTDNSSMWEREMGSQSKLAGLTYSVIALWVLEKDPALLNELESDGGRP